jgi:endo-1,4-beta-xylanase
MQILKSHPQFNLRPNRKLVLGVCGIVVAAMSLLFAAGHSSKQSTHSSSRVQPGVNMLTQNWRHMPGVSRGGSVLAVHPSGFTIVKQDGSGGQPNPPVNEYGTHLEVSGDFTIDATIIHNQGDATLQLYDAPPTVADEFRVEPASVRVTTEDNQLVVEVMDGSRQKNVASPAPVYLHTFSQSSETRELAIVRTDDTLSIFASGKVVAALPWGSIFRSGQLWFGLSSTHGGYELSSLNVQGNKVKAVDTTLAQITKQPGGLQALADTYRPGFKVGTAVALAPFVSDTAYSSIVVSNYGSITLENAMKPQFISPRQGVYDFAEADALIRIAQLHGLQVHGHTIAFSEAEPHWMRELPTDTPAERAGTQKILLEYATTVAGHFKDSLTSLDVINEPFDTDDGPTLQRNIWYKAFGPNYAATVLHAVHAAAPNVKLFINENGAEQPGDRQDALFTYVQDLKQQGVPIYGVGLQSHVYDIDTDTIEPSQLDSIINQFASIGVKTRISEMDVADDQGTDIQAKQYLDVFKVCILNPNCVSWTTWGVTDKYDMFAENDDGSGQLQYGADLLFNATESPTPAYDRIRSLLKTRH